MDREQIEKWAWLFHDTYERLAPDHGYVTRQDTRVFDPESQNGRLMLAVVGEVASLIRNAALEEAKAVCEERARKHKKSSFKQAWLVATECIDCADAIDALKEK